MNTDHPLGNRLKKRFKHLSKWAKRDNVSCFRVYDRDLAEYPMIVEWIDGDVVVWEYEQKEIVDVVDIMCDAFLVDPSHVMIKKRGRQKGLQTQYQKISKDAVRKIVTEAGLKFELNLSDYLDIGLFLDHRQTRQMCQKLAKNKRFLNLFAYTGSFTCYAMAGEAKSTTTVDLNDNYLNWAKRNCRLNGFDTGGQHRFIHDNCLAFVKLEAAKNRYDLIVCDPPTFSNSKNMKTAFSIDEDYPDLIRSCLKLLAPGGVLVFSTNSRRFKFDKGLFPDTITIDDITHQTIPPDFKNTKIHQVWQISK